MRSLLLVALLHCTFLLEAQRADTTLVDKLHESSRPQAVYAQAGGAGPFISVVYDRRFKREQAGWGFSAGIGYWADFSISFWSIPLSVYHLFGTKHHFFEASAGTTFMTGSSTDIFGGRSTGSGVFFHGGAGYRFQHAPKGFFARAGYSPLLLGGEFFSYAYLGLGYSF